jgi:hypothetical protein
MINDIQFTVVELMSYLKSQLIGVLHLFWK